MAIPKRLRLTRELRRLPVRVIKYSKGLYTLLSRHGQLSRLYPAGELNSVSDVASSTLATGIAKNPPKKGKKPIQITLGKAVALENNRGSVTAAQKAGRKAKGKKRAIDDVEADDNGGEGPATIINSGNEATINSSPSAGPSIRASKRVRRRTYKANFLNYH